MELMMICFYFKGEKRNVFNLDVNAPSCMNTVLSTNSAASHDLRVTWFFSSTYQSLEEYDFLFPVFLLKHLQKRRGQKL